MKDQKFDIYSERYVSLYGEITNGCLRLESLVFGEDRDSEKIYRFSRKDTDRLFEYMPLEEFIDYCRQYRVLGMETLFSQLNLHPDTFVW